MIEYWEPNWTDNYVWIVVVAFIIGGILNSGMGATDCANVFGLKFKL